MEKKTEQGKKKSGRNPVLIMLDDTEYEALRHFCFDNRLKYSPFIKQMIVARLQKESYLKQRG